MQTLFRNSIIVYLGCFFPDQKKFPHTHINFLRMLIISQVFRFLTSCQLYFPKRLHHFLAYWLLSILALEFRVVGFVFKDWHDSVGDTHTHTQGVRERYLLPTGVLPQMPTAARVGSSQSQERGTLGLPHG